MAGNAGGACTLDRDPLGTFRTVILPSHARGYGMRTTTELASIDVAIDLLRLTDKNIGEFRGIVVTAII